MRTQVPSPVLQELSWPGALPVPTPETLFPAVTWGCGLVSRTWHHPGWRGALPAPFAGRRGWRNRGQLYLRDLEQEAAVKWRGTPYFCSQATFPAVPPASTSPRIWLCSLGQGSRFSASLSWHTARAREQMRSPLVTTCYHKTQKARIGDDIIGHIVPPLETQKQQRLV